ncbi:hypothetical protein COEREDRAFT_13494 [Coemansia reversa NRRL 1564]|uniref:Beta-adaptin appendage C-terminal subdomain domain-containing protein n=1 Tax=Coemansia reversa (strain ATCC 12441 / NRRL 1564) TaxID=763665 RepID=A0A2G5BIT3_COERN|nr:hypothetical protein COEREDRAFT_13494 [Coemansia reversa NRRL 1564]|eukprot:PIA18915.1 hypothetical protein COEREDRAFT_13494 [Coemansia reversa NRRL 1564]
MSDAKFFQRGKVHDLRLELTSEKKDPRHQRKKVAMKKVVANMTMGNDMSSLFREVIACMGIPDLEVKKMVYLFLINYARARAEIANHAVNGFEDDVNDPNPLIRAMAIRTMGYIYVERVLESLIDPLRHCLRDRDPYVRKTAAMAVLKLYMFDRSLVEEERFLDMLKDLLADGNPAVVANAVAALTEVSERSPHIKLKLNMKIASKLITALNECNEWGQIYIIESLMYVTPQSSEDAETIIERIMPRLQHGNSGVVLVCIKVIAYMMNYVAKTETLEPILRKLSPPLVTLLASGPEVQYITLRNIQLLLQRWPTILQNQLRAFFCKYDDPIYVKLAKLEVILSLTTEENARVVLTELVEYATEIDVDFVRKAVRSIGRIAIKIELAADRCVRALMDLIQTKVNYVVQEAIVVIRDVFRKYPNRYEAIIGTLCQNLDTLDEPEARAAMVWIIGQYADRIENSDEVLGKFLETFLDDPAEVQLALLTAIVKLFIMRPTAGQDLVPKVLKWATEEIDSPDIRDRGFIYWRLLSTDPEMARTVVLSEKPEISAEGERLEMPLLEELLLQVGSLSSIYRKPPSSFIPFAKKRVLGQSPALSRLTIAPPPMSRLPRTNTVPKGQVATKHQSGGSGQADSQQSGLPRSNSAQMSSSMLDVTNQAGLSNPYLNDVTPGFMSNNDAVLIDLMSMDYNDDPSASNMAVNSGGMLGFNGNFGSSGMNIPNMDMPFNNNSSSGSAKDIAVGSQTNAAFSGAGTASTSASVAPDSQMFNSAFDAAGLDALSNMPTSASSLSAARATSNRSPVPDLVRQFTSTFELSALGSAASGNSSQPADSHQQQQLFSPPGSTPTSISPFGPSAFPTALSSKSNTYPAGNSSNNTSNIFDVSSSFATPTSANSLLNSNSFAAVSGTAAGTTSVTALDFLLPTTTTTALTTTTAPLAASATFDAGNSSLIQQEVNDLATKMYNTGMLNSFQTQTTGDSGAVASSSSAPYVPARRVLLDAQQTQGLEILGTFARRQGQIQMDLSLANRNNIPIGDFAIQFNKNTFGIMPGAPLALGTLGAMCSMEVSIPLAMGGPSMVMQPLTNIQIAFKCTMGIFYFQTQFSLHILLDENGQSDQGTFLRMWKAIPETMQGSTSMQSLRFTSMEDMRDKLNMNNVFTVAQRSIAGATHFYTSSKLCDGTIFYSEIKVSEDFRAAVITTKSNNVQAIVLYQEAINGICTAM